MREDWNEQELKTREQMKEAKDAKRVRGIGHENKGEGYVQVMGKLMHRGEQELLSLWEGWNWMTTKAGGLTLSCAPRQDARRRSTFVPTRSTRESQRRAVRARLVAKEQKTHARPESHASTPPLEALRDVLSEVVTGKRGGKFVAMVDVRRAYFYAPA